MLQRVGDIKFDDLDELGSTKLIPLDFALDGIYGHSSTAYSSVPIQVMVPELADIDNYNTIEARLILDYETEGAATMDVQLFNYTDFVAIAGTEENMPNQTWGHGSTAWFDITAQQGKALRVQTKRVGGTALNDVKLEGALLMLRLKK